MNRTFRGFPHKKSSFSPGRRSFGRARPIKSFNPQAMVLSMPGILPIQPQPQITHKFEDFDVDKQLMANVLQRRYEAPTPIQDQAIPYILQGRDFIGIANTGTGKTLAFLLPLINKVIKNRSEKILIVAPTRELAVQIRDEFLIYAKNLNMTAVLCIGGTGLFGQKFSLKKPFNFVIGTPGRIKDLTKERYINLATFNTVVLDEVDRMVDIGFINDIKYFISLLPKNRQSLFFSATIDGKVREIIANFVINPVTISVTTRETAENVRQDIVKVLDRNRKVDQLHDLLIKKEFEKVLIFGRTKWGVQKLSDELVKRGFKSEAIHGNKNQSQRLKTLERFKRSEIQILLATDVASRGLDIPNVSHVINYDLPDTRDAYVHRIGRTGRADKKGIALTFVD